MTWNIFRYIWYFFKGNSTWWPPNLTLSEHWASRTQKIMTPLFSVYLEYQTNFEGISKTLALNWYTREASCFVNHFALFFIHGENTSSCADMLVGGWILITFSLAPNPYKTYWSFHLQYDIKMKPYHLVKAIDPMLIKWSEFAIRF